jgi:pimeloyl-ACP methyl ester carboxylesterase
MLVTKQAEISLPDSTNRGLPAPSAGVDREPTRNSFEILRRAPERVLKLALLDTQARPDSPEALARRRDLIALAERGAFRAAIARLLPRLVHPDRRGDPVLVERITAMANRVGWDAFLRQQTAILHRPDSRPSLAAIVCPTLVLVGRQDLLTPVDVHQKIAAAIPNATLVVLPRCGHLSPLERPAMVNAQLAAWLDV